MFIIQSVPSPVKTFSRVRRRSFCHPLCLGSAVKTRGLYTTEHGKLTDICIRTPNASLRSIVRRDTGEAHRQFLIRLARRPGMKTSQTRGSGSSQLQAQGQGQERAMAASAWARRRRILQLMEIPPIAPLHLTFCLSDPAILLTPASVNASTRPYLPQSSVAPMLRGNWGRGKGFLHRLPYPSGVVGGGRPSTLCHPTDWSSRIPPLAKTDSRPYHLGQSSASWRLSVAEALPFA